MSMGNASCSQNSQLVAPMDGEESAGVEGQPIIQEAGRVLRAEAGVQVTTSPLPGSGALNKPVTPSESPVSSVSRPSAGAGKALSKGGALVHWDVQSLPRGAPSPDDPGVRWGQKWAET